VYHPVDGHTDDGVGSRIGSIIGSHQVDGHAVRGAGLRQHGQSIVLAVGSILAASITGTNTWSGLPVAVGALGTALASWPLARLMARSGRRPGLALGYSLAIVGALLGMAGVAVRSFPLMLAGMALFGIASTSNLLARYAAADVSTGAQRGRAMGLIVWGSTVGSMIGPNLMGPALRVGALLGIESTASAFLVSVAGYALGALLIQIFLRPDPLTLARQAQEIADAGATAVTARSLGVILNDVRVQIALATLAVSQFVMISTTSTSPLYLHDQGHNVQTIGLAVSLHLAGMYVTSPLAGWLSGPPRAPPHHRRGGGDRCILAVMLAGCARAAIASSSSFALFLNGVGWNIAFVAGQRASHRRASLRTSAHPSRAWPISSWA
jgi:MFS family permease